ncbi:MAG: hypothetical protein ACE5KE_06160 [Methanosarcinales archaeon]
MKTQKQMEEKKEDFKKKIDEIYGYDTEISSEDKENMFSKFIKYLEQMRERQAGRARVKMRKMID